MYLDYGKVIGDTGTYRVALMRDNTFVDYFIGSVDVPRNGSESGSWSSVNAGIYYFIFTKTIND